jgi:hypothetical protein
MIRWVPVTDDRREARVPPLPILVVATGLLALVLVLGIGPARAQDETDWNVRFDPAAWGQGGLSFEPIAWDDRGLSVEPIAWDDRGLSVEPIAWADTAEPVAVPYPYRPTPPWKDVLAVGDWAGLGRDTALLVSYQLLGIAFYYVMPESISKWDQSQKDNANFNTWLENVQNPVWDNDEWYVNAGHAIVGAWYYIRARERGFGEISSFLYSAFASTVLYEFGVEAFFENPSYQDLIITPIGGALLGAFVFEPVRRVIFAKPELRWYDHLMLVATDPIGTANYFVEKLFGIKSEIRVDARPPAFMADTPSRYRIGPSRPVGDSHTRDSGVSVELRIRWN